MRTFTWWQIWYLYLYVSTGSLQNAPQKIENTTKGEGEATQQSSCLYPTKVISLFLLSHSTARLPSLVTKIEDCSLALGRQTGAHPCILSTAMQLFIFCVVALWWFFINKKVKWGDSHCDEPCSTGADDRRQKGTKPLTCQPNQVDCNVGLSLFVPGPFKYFILFS